MTTSTIKSPSSPLRLWLASENVIYHRKAQESSLSPNTQPILTCKLEKAKNKPISSTHAKPVKALPDMNKARSEKAIYGPKTNPFQIGHRSPPNRCLI
jgi:hypothetical protein